MVRVNHYCIVMVVTNRALIYKPLIQMERIRKAGERFPLNANHPKVNIISIFVHLFLVCNLYQGYVPCFFGKYHIRAEP